MSFYLVDDIEQGTATWHQWRKGVIGASEAGVIMGENRWKGRQQLIDEKLGLAKPFAGNDVTREGNLYEPHARKALENKFREKLAPTIVQDSSDPFLAASLDAINSSKNKVYEIKCGARTYEMFERTGSVPPYYVAQLQHMLMVTQMESLIFAAYRPSEPLLTSQVFRNESYIRELRKKEKDFVKELVSRGHAVQYEFRGYEITSNSSNRRREESKTDKAPKNPQWIIEDGLTKFWNGEDFLVGDEAGLYEIDESVHYWDGEEWFIPSEVGTYDLNGEVMYWNGKQWE